MRSSGETLSAITGRVISQTAHRRRLVAVPARKLPQRSGQILKHVIEGIDPRDMTEVDGRSRRAKLSQISITVFSLFPLDETEVDEHHQQPAAGNRLDPDPPREIIHSDRTVGERAGPCGQGEESVAVGHDRN
jgi:hypothetical protein